MLKYINNVKSNSNLYKYHWIFNFTLINVNDIGIVHVGPSEIGINQETEVKIIIDKNDFSGPGRLRLDFNQKL